VFAFMGGQVAPFPKSLAAHVTGMGIPLPVFILTRSIFTVILIVAFTRINIVITFLCHSHWLPFGLDARSLQGAEVSGGGRLPAIQNMSCPSTA
jgi:hypothetical protein